ncbi:MAG: hypothetical protein HY710_03855 [Candidatus Latescibacteria bacterium]|nr:hypothetical protein [Candidatus Latescibacterota bacterium]
MNRPSRFDQGDYERPTQKWVCGWAAEGRACRVGPDQKGRCQATYECFPVRKGDRWSCARPPGGGGPCEEGPLPDGTCCHPIPTCQPVRSLRTRRGMVTLLVSAFTFSLLLLFLAGPRLVVSPHLFVSPGPLVKSHEVIRDCAACHVAAQEHPVGELLAVLASGIRVADSQQCITCHRSDQGLKPHGLPPQNLSQITERMKRAPSPLSPSSSLSLAPAAADVRPDEHGELACVPCHGEHLGRTVRLTRIDNQYCQPCHLVRFPSLMNGHPEFTGYPSQSRSRWQFNHVSHEKEHFPTKGIAFGCQHCHRPALNRRTILTDPFERTCTGCHLEHIQRGSGIAVFNLPGVDFETLLDHGIEIGEWPDEANLDLEEDLTPFMALLLSADPKVARDLDELARAGVHLYDLEKASERQVAAAGRVVWAVKGLYYDLLTNGRAELVARLTKAFGVPLSPRDVPALTGQSSEAPGWLFPVIQPDWLNRLQAAQRRWLPDVMAEVPLYRAGKTVTLKELAMKFIATGDAERENPVGGWSRVDRALTLFYRPAGHADHFVRAWVDVTGKRYGTAGRAAEIFEILTASAPDTPGQCMRCHARPDAQSQQGRLVEWTEERSLPAERRAVKFSHAPHLIRQACRACHALHAARDFKPIVKATCTTCHTGQKMNDNCLTCHTYHVGTMTTALVMK